MRKVFLFILWGIMAVAVQAQMVDPVHFKSELKTGKGAEAEIVFTATIDAGWHVYSTDLGNDGPISASFHVVKMDGAEKVGKLMPKGNVIKEYDKLFEMELKYFEKQAQFVQKIKFTKPTYDIDCYLEYGACNDQSCMPPSEVPLKVSGKAPVQTEEKKEEDNGNQKDIEAQSEASGTPVGNSTLSVLHSKLLCTAVTANWP